MNFRNNEIKGGRRIGYVKICPGMLSSGMPRNKEQNNYWRSSDTSLLTTRSRCLELRPNIPGMIQTTCEISHVIKQGKGKTLLPSSVKISGAKVLIQMTVPMPHTGNGTAILRGHPSHEKVKPFVWQRQHLHFSVT